ncbi:DNA cytosine methyltransferase [Mycoplasma seminis]|uniref:Cytosine-specific methyltransferase n=1 Tax=Mycoplasma seminis TaxID=512749 RepID=A0ABY9HAP6_9MOLU|nr:DNA cytosine methyltransferase [Mycoplasma seminis]WLP85617.1 DNA cytosine methyltransferase [Mycoplasma seminis]
MKRNNKIGSFFAGVGGIDLGFSELGTTVYANEYNPIPAITFEKNFNLKVDVKDIKDVDANTIPDFNILIAGFPCQAFSIAGYRQGFNDEKGRGNLFFDLARIIEVKNPEVIFLENVKNLKSHDKGKTLKVILETLSNLGYCVKYDVLNTSKFGNIPQNRERIYIVGFKDKNKCDSFNFPKEIKLTTSLNDVVDFETQKEQQYYYDSRFKNFELIESEIKSKETIYQWRRKYVRENKNNLCPTLTANMGTGGHNVPLILTDKGIRKLTPRECFNLQGFPSDFQLPSDVSNSNLYKQAGNSVSVTVVKRIADEIKKVL